MHHDTIAAIATPVGEGGIGIIRISGPDAISIAKQGFRPKKDKDIAASPSHRLHYGHFLGAKGEAIDEVLLAVMKGPHTFTTEDVVEIHGHGGVVVLRNLLERVLQLGARLAEPGEFTKRAFLGGRLDLSQAEAVIDLIRAKTKEGARLSLEQLGGNLSRPIEKLRQELLEILAFIEANIDFPEEDIENIGLQEVLQRTSRICTQLQGIRDTASRGKILRDGIKTAIVGRPNVGKSSLLNSLLREQRAIVTEIPGTTRDTIEEFADLAGVPLRLVDTAGIRDTDDVVERIGVEKSKEALAESDLILLVIDGSEALHESDKELLQGIKDKKALILVNKRDKGRVVEDGLLRDLAGDKPIIPISAKDEDGLESLIHAIHKMVQFGEVTGSREPILQNARQAQCLDHALNHLKEVLQADPHYASLDMLSIDLRAAWEILGEITGQTVGEDLLDQIFSQFCIGK